MRRSNLLLAFVVFLAGLAYFAAFLDYGLNLDDEGTLLYQIERVADGQQVYTDFHIGYTPAIYHFHAWIFHTFGVSVIPIRAVLALVNATALAGLVLLAGLVAPTWIAWLPAFGYLASIPVHPGEFASFNIPYPVWYNVAFFVWGLLALERFGSGGRLRWLALSGLLAALGFMFKPNVGLLQLAATALGMLSVLPMPRPENRRLSGRSSRCCWWGLWVSALAGVWIVFSGMAGIREVGVFLLSVTLAARMVAWRSMVAPPPPRVPAVVPSTLVLAASFVIPNILWMVPVYRMLGRQRFLTDVLFIGADFERFYYIEHPPVFHALILALTLLGFLALVPRLLLRGRLPADVLCAGTLVAAAAVGYVGVGHALMPEGFLAAVGSAYEANVFAVSVMLQWAGLLLLARSVGIDDRSRLPSLRWVLVVLGSACMYCVLYPRTDYMHWVTAAPITLVIAAGVLARLAGLWSSRLSLSRFRASLVHLSWVLPVALILALHIVPGIDATVNVSQGRIERPPRVWLANERAPVWINAGRVVRYEALAGVADYLRERTAPDEQVFTFPSLDVVSFLSDRHNPTRHGYFYPRWPGHDVEAEVVGYLMAKRPRFIVVLHKDSLFFGQAWAYYFTLRDYMTRFYRRYEAIGPYVVLIRRDLEPDEAVPEIAADQALSLNRAGLFAGPEPNSALASRVDKLKFLRSAERMFLEQDDPRVSGLLGDSSADVRSLAVWAMRQCRDPRCGRKLARAVKAGRLGVRESILALRVAGQSADITATRSLWATAMASRGRISDEAATALFHITNRMVQRSYWPFRKAQERSNLGQFPLARLRKRELARWATNPDGNQRLRLYAVWILSEGDGSQAERALRQALEASDIAIKRLALSFFVRRTSKSEYISTGLDLLARDDIITPNFIASNGNRRSVGDRALARVILREAGTKRMLVAWLAAVAGGVQTERTLVSMLSDADPTIRAAAVWGLHYRGATDQLERIRPLLSDPDQKVRAFATRAVEFLSGH